MLNDTTSKPNPPPPTTSPPPSTTSCAPSRPSRTPTTSASPSSSSACRPTSSPPTRSTASTAPLDEHKRVVDELALKSARPHLGGPAPAPAPPSSTRPPSTPTCARARPARCATSRPRRSRSAPTPTAAISCPTRLERADQPRRAGRLADPRHRRRPPGVGLGLQEAVRHHRRRDRLGRPRPPRGPRPTRRRWPSSPSRPWSSTPCRRRPRRCSTTRAVNIDEWIAEEVRDAFAQQEGTAFVTGNGTNKPKGFLDYTKVANASWSWGNIGFIKTGVAGAFAAHQPRRQADRPRLRGEVRLPRRTAPSSSTAPRRPRSAR